MVTSSLSERRGAGPGRSKACWIMTDPFIVSSTMVKMVVRTMALSSIGSTLLVCLCCLQTTAYYSSHFLSATSTKRVGICSRAKGANHMKGKGKNKGKRPGLAREIRGASQLLVFHNN